MRTKRDRESINESSKITHDDNQKEQDYSFANNKEVIIASILVMLFAFFNVVYLMWTLIKNSIRP